MLKGSILAALCALAMSIHAAAAPRRADDPSRWLSVQSRARTATLTLVAGYNGVQEGFNFDGYAHGAMVVRIPLGYRVQVVYRNAGPWPHSVMVTPYAARNLPAGWPVAFPGAASPDRAGGAPHGAVQRFAFTVNRVGLYAIICAVSGHEQVGMWDVLQVTRGGSASISVVRGR